MAAGSGETVQTVPRGQDQGRQKQVKEQLAPVLKKKKLHVVDL